MGERRHGGGRPAGSWSGRLRRTTRDQDQYQKQDMAYADSAASGEGLVPEAPSQGVRQLSAIERLQEMAREPATAIHDLCKSQSPVQNSDLTSRVIRALRLHTDDDLAAFLRQRWFIEVYDEYAKWYLLPCLQRTGSADPSVAAGTEALLATSWTASKALLTGSYDAFRHPQSMSMYLGPATPAIQGWDDHQHQIRFMAQFILKSADQPLWTSQDSLATRCIVSFQLSHWLRCVHGDFSGRQGWYRILRDASSGHETEVPRVSSPQHQIAFGNQQQWMQDGARPKLLREFRALCDKWGVSERHEGSCLLVRAGWRHIQPKTVLDAALSGLPVEPDPTVIQRLRFTFGKAGAAPFARALLWHMNDSSPNDRTIDDVRKFQDPNMHASHRCHQGTCILPSHLVLEPSGQNHSRRSCHKFAQRLRSYNMDIPGLCGNHNPPCLLQHASLEVEEAMFLQLRVFAKAKGVPITGELQSAYKHPRNSTRTMITDFDLLPRSRDPDGLPAAGGIKEEIHDGQRRCPEESFSTSATSVPPRLWLPVGRCVSSYLFPFTSFAFLFLCLFLTWGGIFSVSS